jgi:CheY-like chemotaxis protein
MITADAGDLQVLNAVAAGALGAISKPFTLRQIQTCMESLGLAIRGLSGNPRTDR